MWEKVKTCYIVLRLPSRKTGELLGELGPGIPPGGLPGKL